LNNQKCDLFRTPESLIKLHCSLHQEITRSSTVTNTPYTDTSQSPTCTHTYLLWSAGHFSYVIDIQLVAPRCHTRHLFRQSKLKPSLTVCYLTRYHHPTVSTPEMFGPLLTSKVLCMNLWLTHVGNQNMQTHVTAS